MEVQKTLGSNVTKQSNNVASEIKEFDLVQDIVLLNHSIEYVNLVEQVLYVRLYFSEDEEESAKLVNDILQEMSRVVQSRQPIF